MVTNNTDVNSTAFTVTVDHVRTSTGISAADRAVTTRVLADSSTQPLDLRRSGHVFPLRARRGGVLKRVGHTKAAIENIAYLRTTWTCRPVANSVKPAC